MVLKNCGWMENDIIFTGINNLRDPLSLRVKERIEKIANLKSSVLLVGETGVGKDFWANYLLQISQVETMLNLNCGDVPETLLESEWFGFKRGAFTGAVKDYEGKWKTAGNGILFLNQIDLLSLNLQARLLRIIERKKFFPLGSNREVDIRARFLFSADSDIEEKVSRGEFRSDLYYRISTYKIYIPPLRERKSDILPLVMFFARKMGLTVDLSQRGLKALREYRWRGNIREIENFITNTGVLHRDLNDEHVIGLLRNAMEFLETKKEADISLMELEREYIYYLLKKYRSKVKVADILRISRKSLYNKLKKYEGH
jgi:transcriptional regulator with PAS, ATPase and Fis domain